LQFLHQMLNVSALLLDDTLLKCEFVAGRYHRMTFFSATTTYASTTESPRTL